MLPCQQYQALLKKTYFLSLSSSNRIKKLSRGGFFSALSRDRDRDSRITFIYVYSDFEEKRQTDRDRQREKNREIIYIKPGNNSVDHFWRSNALIYLVLWELAFEQVSIHVSILLTYTQ